MLKLLHLLASPNSHFGAAIGYCIFGFHDMWIVSIRSHNCSLEQSMQNTHPYMHAFSLNGLRKQATIAVRFLVRQMNQSQSMLSCRFVFISGIRCIYERMTRYVHASCTHLHQRHPLCSWPMNRISCLCFASRHSCAPCMQRHPLLPLSATYFAMFSMCTSGIRYAH